MILKINFIKVKLPLSNLSLVLIFVIYYVQLHKFSKF